METARKPTPRDFPLLFTRKEVRNMPSKRSWPQCSVCRLVVEPRNRQRHVKACARRKRLAPDLWMEWYLDMHGASADDPRRPAVVARKRAEREQARQAS